MFENLIKIAFRVIRKDLFYSLFNIAGLTIGITSSIFLLLYVSNELSYDKYHENSENIYRVVSHISEPDDAFAILINSSLTSSSFLKSANEGMISKI